MINRFELKKDAKASLIGKYGDSIGIVLFLGFLTFFLEMVIYFFTRTFGFSDEAHSILNFIFSFLLSSFLTLGYYNFFLKISRDEDVEINELWSKAYLFVPYIILSIVMSLFIFCFTLLLIIPGIVAALSYSMSYYIMLDYPEMGTLEILKESKRMMRGHKMEYLILLLSFLGWAILGIFTLGILWLWLIPYMNVTMANFYNKIKELA